MVVRPEFWMRAAVLIGGIVGDTRYRVERVGDRWVAFRV
jgi:hypothetical protein